MINYGRILKAHEKDNPSPFCRASYLISNVGDMIKCYGRMLRFPNDAHIYQKEMELAMGDVIMQCRLIEEDMDGIHEEIFGIAWGMLEDKLIDIVCEIGILADHVINKYDVLVFNNGRKETTREQMDDVLEMIGDICAEMKIDVKKIEHLGFIHTIERFEQFEREGWG